MTTRFDDEEDPEFGPFDPTSPEHAPDDPLLVLLGPTPTYLGAPPGRYEEIRRTATRRRRVRTAAGVGMACVVAALVALPLNLTTGESPRSPTIPMAPPVSTVPATPPPSDATTDPSTDPTPLPSTPESPEPSTAVPSDEPSEAATAESGEASIAPPDQAPVSTPEATTGASAADDAPTPSQNGADAVPSATVTPVTP